jgi:predicted Zn-dependent protease with MMP-like domain
VQLDYIARIKPERWFVKSEIYTPFADAERPFAGPGARPPAAPSRRAVAGLVTTFEETVARALASLPPELREAVRNIEITIEDEHPDDPDLFGLYEGVPLPERGDWAGSMPDRIRIFRLPLVESFPDPAELEEEIRVTVLHELGHYFGLDEDRLDDLGYS